MDGQFNPVKTTRKVQSNIDKFETLSLTDDITLKPRTPSTKSKISVLDIGAEASEADNEVFSLRPSHDSSATSRSTNSHKGPHKRHDSTAFIQRTYLDNAQAASLPDDAREILRSQPDSEDLLAVLQYLQYGIQGKHGFNIHVPGPKGAQIINVLVTTTLPDWWVRLQQGKLSRQDSQLKAALLSTLSSIGGIGALLMQIRQMSATNANQQSSLLVDLLSVLSSVLTGSRVVLNFLSDATTLLPTEGQRRAFWQELTALLAGSKVLTTTSAAFATHNFLNGATEIHKWLGNGLEYSKWLAKNISTAAISLTAGPISNHGQINMLSQILKRALSLGYRDALVVELYTSLLLGNRALWSTMHALMQALPSYDQKAIFDAILRDLALRFLQSGTDAMENKESLIGDAPMISAAAALINGLVQNNPLLEAHVVQFLTATSGEYAGIGIGARRAVIATLATSQDKLEQVLEKSLATFGSKIQIQHGTILQQESTAQTILLTVGYLSRMDMSAVERMAKSGEFLRMVSDRLSASVPRARFLGMIVAVAVSKVVDRPDKVINFEVEEMESEEAQRWFDLVQVQDKLGILKHLQQTTDKSVKKRPSRGDSNIPPRKRVSNQPTPQTAKIIAIEELSDSEEDTPKPAEVEDDELRPYALPDSDPSDSDDDPTLVNRNKPTAPVYITSLIKQLHANDDIPAMELALKTAPSLIRRKANFGDELSQNILPLASSLLNLQEITSRGDTQKQQIDAFIACLVSKPQVMGPWIANTYFEGDFSLVTRSALLTAVALGARELAGINDDVEGSAAGEKPNEPLFPSKRLPSSLEQTYTSLSPPIDDISRTLSYNTLQPMALEAADKMTGPNILKVRTFSSRMEVAAKTAAKLDARAKRIPKELHKILAESLYLPLCSRLTLLLSSLSSSPYLAKSTLLHPSLLKLSLQTLIVIIATIGPNALQLPTLTRESLLLLTALHTIPSLAHDATILPPTLHLLLTLLDLNVEAGTTAEERLVTDFGPMIAELTAWAASLGDGVSIPEVHDDPGLGMAMPWPVLVAGIQVKWQEVGRKFQGRMLGLMAGADFDSFYSTRTPFIPQKIAFQPARRWATTEAQKEEQDGITASEHIDPPHATEAQETVSASADAAPAIAESANATEATEEALPASETGEKLASDSSISANPYGHMLQPKPTLYVGNLFFDVTETDIVKEFSRFGTVTKSRIVRDSRGLSKGFGYIEFSTQEAADAAMNQLNMSLFEGRRITVQYAARQETQVSSTGSRRTLNPPSKTLFIGNMSFEMTDRDLTNLFRGVRNVIDVRVAIDRRTGQPRGFAHADFVDIKSAMEAMEQLTEKEIYGRKLKVDFSFSSASNRAPRNNPPPTEEQ